MLSTGYPGVSQGLLLESLQKIFPGEYLETNSRKDSDIKNPETGKFIELDITLPKHNLCFEFQDLHHYSSAWYAHTPLSKIINNDRLKQEQVRERGDILIAIPCWWLGSQEELAATIASQRPDVVEFFDDCSSSCSLSPAISLNPPFGFFKDMGVPEIGELMLASFPPDVNWSDTVSPSNAWWMGEKVDGIRVCWDFRKQILYTRFGVQLNLIPLVLQENLQNLFLDGELWFGRGTFVDSQKIASNSEMIDWQHLRFVVFDAAELKTQDNREMMNYPYELRYRELLNSVHNDHPFVKVTSRIYIKDRTLLLLATENIISNEGEGVVLRRPSSLYHHGRSLDILKIKAARRDEEGIVLAVELDGSLLVKLPNDKEFTIPRQNLRLSIKAKVGDIISFSCDSFSFLGTPVNPHVFRIRFDLSWSDLLSSTSSSRHLNNKVMNGKTIHHWTLGKRKNQRQFLEEFAIQNNLNPLLPETWYNLPVKKLTDTKGGSTIIRHFKGNYRRMLFQLFPDILLDETKFVQLTIEKRYQSVTNRRKLFDLFAKQNNFDPLVARNWYNVSAIKLGKLRGILQFYSNSVARAVQHLYPEIGINQSQYPILSWKESKTRKRLFLKFSQHYGFDPLVPDNWYSTPTDIILAFKGMKAVLNYYNNLLPKALASLFPNIGLKEDGFSPRVHKNYWHNYENRKKFMLSFAELSGFNPLVPENWYPVSSQDIVSKRGATFLAFYNNSLSKAVVDIFPDIGIQEFMFHRLSKKYWTQLKNRKGYFMYLAKEFNFEPLNPNNWYNMKVSQVQKGILVAYGSLYKALQDTFPSIGLEEHKFRTQYTQLFSDRKNRREFFERYAKENDFDPLVATNWYPVQGLHVWAQPGGRALAALYSGSYSKALIDSFPDLLFNCSLFAFPKNYWTDIDNRRKLFVDIAYKLGFDPFKNPDKWNSVSRASLLQFKGASRVLGLSGNSVNKTIMALFPEINLETKENKTVSR